MLCTERDETTNEVCDEGRTYVTGLCQGKFSFDSGKSHNHCVACPGFGTCIGDYRMSHQDCCGKHMFVGLCGPLKGESKCDNRKCTVFKKWQSRKLVKTFPMFLEGHMPDDRLKTFLKECAKKVSGVSPPPSDEDSSSDSDSDYYDF